MPDHNPPRKHAETDFERRMRLATEEMEQGGLKDPTADMQVYSASKEITTSPKILNHDVPWEQIRNAHPGLESVDIEALLEYVHDKPLAEIITEGYPPPDKARLQEVLAMDYIQAGRFAGANDPLLWSDEDYDEEGQQDG